MLSQADWVNSVESTNEESQQPTTAALVYYSDYHPTFPRLPAQVISLTAIGFLSHSLFIFIILAMSVIASVFTQSSVPFFGTSRTMGRNKRGKDRPEPLDLTLDLEAQNRPRHHQIYSNPCPTRASSTVYPRCTMRSTVTSTIEMDNLALRMLRRDVGSSRDV